MPPQRSCFFDGVIEHVREGEPQGAITQPIAMTQTRPCVIVNSDICCGRGNGLVLVVAGHARAHSSPLQVLPGKPQSSQARRACEPQHLVDA